MAESESEWRAAHAAAASSRTIESTPPESATATRIPGRRCSRNAAAIAASTAELARSGSAGGDFLELAIAEQLLLARVEQHVERLLLRVAQRLGQGFLQRRHQRRVVAVGAAQRLGDHLVDQAQGLQARRGDAERLG